MERGLSVVLEVDLVQCGVSGTSCRGALSGSPGVWGSPARTPRRSEAPGMELVQMTAINKINQQLYSWLARVGRS